MVTAHTHEATVLLPDSLCPSLALALSSLHGLLWAVAALPGSAPRVVLGLLFSGVCPVTYLVAWCP